MALKFELAEMDAVAWLRSLPGARVDLVITDPPYESLERHRAIGTTLLAPAFIEGVITRVVRELAEENPRPLDSKAAEKEAAKVPRRA
jgi:DNA modification methylase